MQKLSQRDKKWGKEKLGTSPDTTIASHGCTITCLAMLAGLNPSEVNKMLISGGGYAQTNLVWWTKIQACIPWLQFEFRGYKYNNAKVKAAIEKNGACIVAVDVNPADGFDKEDHWVLYIGKQKMIDPWDGKEKSTSTYKAVGYSIINVVGEKPTQDNESVSPWLANSDKWRGLVWWLLGEKANPEATLLDEVKRVISGIRSRVTDLERQLVGETSEKENREEQVSRLKEQLLEQEKLNKALNSSLKSALKEPAKLIGVYEGQLETKQGVIDTQGKTIGKLKTELAQCKLDLKGSEEVVEDVNRLKEIARKIIDFVKKTIKNES